MTIGEFVSHCDTHRRIFRAAGFAERFFKRFLQKMLRIERTGLDLRGNQTRISITFMDCISTLLLYGH